MEPDDFVPLLTSAAFAPCWEGGADFAVDAPVLPAVVAVFPAVVFPAAVAVFPSAPDLPADEAGFPVEAPDVPAVVAVDAAVSVD